MASNFRLFNNKVFRTLMTHETRIPVIDVFAGPGGLAEGFHQVGWKQGNPSFQIALSIEKDELAYKTLLLRNFFRQFPYGEAPDEYYQHLRDKKDPFKLFEMEKFTRQAEYARAETWKGTLGSGDEFDHELDQRLYQILNGKPLWTLIGGPPCQAYSVIGRSRNRGISDYVPEQDHRHFLYREYLRIIGKHEPAVFIMENVKGLLSAKLNGESIFAKIKRDMGNPSLSSETSKRKRYQIFSLVKKPYSFDNSGAPIFSDRDFVVEAEHYGIPQTRHRVILFGVRDDLLGRGVKPKTLELLSKIPLENVLADLPKLRSGVSDAEDNPEIWRGILQQFRYCPYLS